MHYVFVEDRSLEKGFKVLAEAKGIRGGHFEMVRLLRLPHRREQALA